MNKAKNQFFKRLVTFNPLYKIYEKKTHTYYQY